MMETGALRERLVWLFGLQRRPAQLAGALGKAGIMIAKIRESDPQYEMTNPVPEDDAYCVGLVPRDNPHFRFRKTAARPLRPSTRPEIRCSSTFGAIRGSSRTP